MTRGHVWGCLIVGHDPIGLVNTPSNFLNRVLTLLKSISLSTVTSTGTNINSFFIERFHSRIIWLEKVSENLRGYIIESSFESHVSAANFLVIAVSQASLSNN